MVRPSWLSLHVRVLRRMGMWHVQPELGYGLYSALVVAWLHVTFLQQLTALVVTGDASLESVCLTVAVASLGLQLLYVRRRGAALQRFVDDVRDVDSFLEARYPRLCAPLHRNRRIIARITLGLYAMVAFIFVSWTVVPVTLFYLWPGSFQLQLPFEAWFPFDTASWWQFSLAYLDLTLIFGFYSPIYISLNALFIDSVSQLSSKLRILVQLMRNITTTDETSESLVKEENFHSVAREKIVECVQLHQRILKLHKQLEMILSPVLAIKFSSGILNIVQFALQAAMENGFSNSMLKNLAFVAVISFEILTYCYYGERLVNCSEKVNLAAYNSLWYLLDRRCKILLKYVMLQTSRTMYISIGKMYKLTLETFKEMMHVTYALFTIMRQASM